MPAPANSGTQLPDQEYFCAARSGTDFPPSLLKPYPAAYKPPVVFAVPKTSPASQATASLAALALLVLAVAVALLF